MVSNSTPRLIYFIVHFNFKKKIGFWFFHFFYHLISAKSLQVLHQVHLHLLTLLVRENKAVNYFTYLTKNTDDYVEKIDYLETYIKKAIKQYGKENLIIKPDCGFLPLKDSFGEKDGYEISIGKVKNMVKALNKIK